MARKSKNKSHCRSVRAALQWVWCRNSLRMALIQRVDLATASRVTDVPHFEICEVQVHRPRCKVLMGSLNIGTMTGTALEVVNIMDRRTLEV